jgi:hypothetical protein
LLQSHIGPNFSILKRERDLFGFDHCEAGRNLVADWNLPPEFESVVACHHEPRQPRNSWQMMDLIGLSCRMADAAGFPVFPGCEVVSYPELIEELPARERNMFCSDIDTLAFDIASKINALEST